jgi:hypothetical protein
MSQINCPICGKYTPESSFLAPRIIQDISGAYMRGLGRGRGFTVANRFSYLGDSKVTSVISDRCNKTLDLLYGTSSMSKNDILRNRDEWIKYAESLKSQNDGLQARNQELVEYESAAEEMEYLLEKINGEVDFEFEYLEDACDYLLELVTLL